MAREGDVRIDVGLSGESRGSARTANAQLIWTAPIKPQQPNSPRPQPVPPPSPAPPAPPTPEADTQPGRAGLSVRATIGLAAALLTAGAALAADPTTSADSSLRKILVDAKGMTLYRFDRHTKSAAASACTGKCIATWPPLFAPAGAAAGGASTIVAVTDKHGKPAEIWAYDWWPLYYFVKDTKAGDGVGGVWHVVKAP